MLGPRELDVIGPEQIDFTFAEEITKRPGGEHLYTCSSCGTCAGTCLLRRVDAAFNPRLIILRATMGLRHQVLSGPEIWECSACDACYPRCPKKIRISDLFKAIRDVAISYGYERHGVPAQVNLATCVGCGMCAEACPYHAIRLETVTFQRQAKQAAQVDKNLCLECGICNSACPSSSISVPGYTDADLHATLASKAGQRDAAGKVLAIVCHWCLHSNVDVRQALQPPEGVEVVRVPCAGRVSPLFITSAFQHGAAGVLVIGCNQGECHYIHGSDIEARRFTYLGELFGMLGMDQQRFRFVRVGSLDRGQFARLTDEFVKNVQDTQPLPWMLERSAQNG